jgi:prevent-host-death family protein
MEYSIYQAKARFSEIIRMVKNRRRVIISERGEPVAEIIPYAQKRAERLADRIAGLARTGSIAPRKEPFRPEVLADIPGCVDRFLHQDRE